MSVDTQPRLESARQAGADSPDAVLRTPDDLAKIVAAAAASNRWIGKVRLCAERRWYQRIHHGPDHDLWVISWLPGQSTGFHDHGGSSGAFVVASGVLEELRPDGQTHLAERGDPRSFGPDYAHDVRNVSNAPAISIHAYSPPLTEMNDYQFIDGQLIPGKGKHWRADRMSPDSRSWPENSEDHASDSRIEQILSAARARLQRVSPEAAQEAAARANAVLVDIRPASQRALEGTIPGALIVERNVLEWRFDPNSDARLPIANDANLYVIVFCSEGYASSLAAADLQDIGLWRATDIVGGFQAWQAAGLPIGS